MTTRAQLEALAERVRGATGPDRAIDAEVYSYVNLQPKNVFLGTQQDEPSTVLFFDLHLKWGDIPSYTTSLDAVVALIERELPGWRGDLDICAPFADDGSFGARLFPPDTLIGNQAEDGKTPALAALAVFLSAKLSSLPEEA